MPDDKQLERLYDYTKFHIGIYLGFAGGIVGLISTAAEGPSKIEFITGLVGCPSFLWLSLLAMFIAGVAGAIVATSTIECKTYADFTDNAQGAFGCKCLNGKQWVSNEHGAFWISLFFLAGSILLRQ